MQRVMKKLRSYLLNREVVLYLIFGVMTTVVNYGVFWLSLRLLGQRWYLAGNVLAFLAATTFAYVTNKLFVFACSTHSFSAWIREITSFFAARLLTFGFEELGLFLFVSVLHWADFIFWGLSGTMIAKIVLSFVAVIANYGISKWFIFKK